MFTFWRTFRDWLGRDSGRRQHASWAYWMTRTVWRNGDEP